MISSQLASLRLQPPATSSPATVPTMKGCLVHNPPTSSCKTPGNCPKRPPNMQRKSVSFCESSEEEEHEKVEVYVADDWDRTPCEVTPKLSYRDIVELYELKLSVPRNKTSGFDPRLPTLLKNVPVALLPLCDTPAPTSKPVPAQRSPLSPPPASFRSNNSRHQFLPLMPLEDESQSDTLPSSLPPSTNRSRLRNFQFLPIYSTEPQSDEDSVDHDHSTSSPTSTPSLTSSSIDSSPPTPSASPSPSLTPPNLTSASDSYFDQPRQPVSVRKVDFLRMNEAAAGRDGSPMAYPIGNPLSKKLTLKAMPSPTLLPPSPFELQASSSMREDRCGEGEQLEDKLSDGELGRRKSARHRFAGTGFDDEVVDDDDDEQFFSFGRRDITPPSHAEKRSSVNLKSPSPVLVPFCKRG